MSESVSQVYVVDDDVSVREAVGSLIRSAGLSVRTFASAQESLGSLREEVPSCLVLDIHEPTTHHYAEITLELRQKGRPIPTNDIWIAALCRQYSFPLLSRDRHFDLVAGTKRIGW